MKPIDRYRGSTGIPAYHGKAFRETSGGPIELNAEQRSAVKVWAADDRLWTTQETVAFNLAVFARVILAAADQ